MTYRPEITKKVIKYLESKINCDNILNFINKNGTIDSLIIEKSPVSLQILDYVDGTDDSYIAYLFSVFDFMVEANHTGFAYFPNIYGVLNCHNKSNSKVYIFFEKFDGNVTELINNMTHSSEWYDIVFYMIMINYYNRNYKWVRIL